MCSSFPIFFLLTGGRQNHGHREGLVGFFDSCRHHREISRSKQGLKCNLVYVGLKFEQGCSNLEPDEISFYMAFRGITVFLLRTNKLVCLLSH